MMLADVTVPWGDWVVSAATTLQPVVTLALTGIASWVVAAYMPPWLKAFAGDAAQRRVNVVLQKAVASAVAQTKEVVSGKATTIPVANTVLARAMQYAVDQAPKLMDTATHGSVDNLSKMVLGRMEEAGITPPAYGAVDAKMVTGLAKKKDDGKFDFTSAIQGHLG